MFRPLTPPPTPRPRRGAILVVVLALLALFAVIAIAFVFYANNEAEISRTFRDAENQGDGANGNDPPDQAEYDKAVNGGLSAFLFGADDSDPGSLVNVLRGHDLMATLYGGVPAAVMPGHPLYGVLPNVSPSVPFNGPGTIHGPLAPPQFGDRGQVINHTAIRYPVGPAADETFLIDPHWTAQRPVTAGTQLGVAPTFSAPNGRNYAPKNAGYTYPDLNNFFLAAVSPVDGRVLVPSFHRSWLFNAANTVNPAYRLAPWNPNDTNPAPAGNGTDRNTDWISPEGRAKILRPRPIDQLTDAEFAAAGLPGRPRAGLTNYPVGPARVNLYNLIQSKIAANAIIGYPPPNAVDPATGKPTYTGDVQNLAGGVGAQQHDSVPLDVGLGVYNWNGKKIKPLLAFLIADQDGLLNLNAHGNVVDDRVNDPTSPTYDPTVPAHRSYAGYGKWEVNPARVYDHITVAANRIALRNEMAALVRSRHGAFRQPVARNGRNSLFYDPSGVRLNQSALVNWNAAGTNPSFRIPMVDSSDPTAMFRTAPWFGTAAPPNAFFDDNDPSDPHLKALNHPSLYRADEWQPLAGSTLAAPFGPFSFPVSDTRRLHARYAAPLDEYRQAALYTPAQLVKTGVIGTYGPDSPNPADRLPERHRLDPAHAIRRLFTTRSAGFDLPALMAAYPPPAGAALALGAFPAVHPVLPATYPAQFVPPAGPGGDFASATDLRNARAALGPVDLNRPLADYRDDRNAALSAANLTTGTNARQARADRQNLARDIFARLVVATGANATVDAAGSVTIPVGLPPDQFNALRYLAQLAANIVDATDGDDINTMFVWNRRDPAMPTQNLPLDVVDAAGGAADVDALVADNATDLANRVVFGVEKPRLVVNEAYGELTNDPNDPLTAGMPAANNFRVRFWVELANPTSDPQPATATPSGPLGDGSVALRNGAASPYQLVITRETAAGAAQTRLRAADNVTGDLAGVPTDLTHDFTTAPANTKVYPGNGAWQASLHPTDAAGMRGFILVGAAPYAMPHTSGGPVEFNPTYGAGQPPIFERAIVGAAAPGTNAMEYDLGSKPSAGSLDGNAGNPLDALRHNVVLLRRLANPYLPFNPQTNPFVTADVMDWVPVFDAVTRGGGTGDNVNRTPKGSPGGTGYDPADATGPPPSFRRFSVGKVQPYAGYAQATVPPGRLPEYTFGQSFVLPQAPTAPGVPPAGQPDHTFGRHNGQTNGPSPTATVQVNAEGGITGLTGTETIAAPFDWLVHFDRAAANPLELLHVQAVKPHEVTQFFWQPPAGGPVVRRGVGQAPWLGVQPTGVPHTDPNTGRPAFDVVTTVNNQRTNNGLYRALDLLRVKPWGHGLAAGGRLHGQINLNTVPDPRVLLAALDPPDTAGANANFFDYKQVYDPANPDDVNALWNRLFNPAPANAPTGAGPHVPFRTVTRGAAAEAGFNPADMSAANLARRHSVPVPGPTIDDDPAGTFTTTPDRPFRQFGGADLPGGGLAAAANNPGGVLGAGLQDTLLRTDANGRPLVWNNALAADQNHPYHQAEMVRKLLNNSTTVSNAFAVHITVVWYEVRTDAAGNPLTYDEGTLGGQPVRRTLLGREAFRETPGDLRQQYFAVIDRSNCWLAPDATPNPTFDPAGNPLNGRPVSPPTVLPTPYTTAVEQGAPSNGTTVAAGAPQVSQLRITYSEVDNAAAPTTMTVFSDGQAVGIGPDSVLVVGTGPTREVVKVAGNTVATGGPAFTPLGGGQVAVNVYNVHTRNGLFHAHAAGELVSNGIAAHPGPQKVSVAGATNSPHRAVVPFVQKVTR